MFVINNKEEVVRSFTVEIYKTIRKLVKIFEKIYSYRLGNGIMYLHFVFAGNLDYLGVSKWRSMFTGVQFRFTKFEKPIRVTNNKSQLVVVVVNHLSYPNVSLKVIEFCSSKRF